MKILMLESLRYDSNTQVGSQAYAREFMRRGHNVFFITQFANPLSMFKNNRGARDLFQSWRNGVVSIGAGSYAYTPLSFLPYTNHTPFGNTCVGMYSLTCTWPSLRRIVRKYGFGDPDVLWITNPKMYSVIQYVKPRIIVHRFADDDSQFSEAPKTLSTIQQLLFERSDIIFATALNLVDKARAQNMNVHYLPNGVNLSRFQGQLPMPTEFNRIVSPRVTYVGAIDKWFDVKLVLFLSRNLPSVSFVLVGPVRTRIQQLAQQSNIHILGPMPPERIGGFLTHSNAGIIPFERNRLTESINPVKLYEYLACGLPTVSTSLKEIKNMKAPILLASNRGEFLKSLQKILSHKSNKKSLINYAKQNQWHQRADYVMEIIQKQLSR